MQKSLFVSTSSLLVISTIAVLAWATDTKKPHSAITPECRRGGHLRRHHEMNKRLKRGNVDLLMIGDSITHSWNGKGKAVWKEYYAGRNVVNLGRSGERTQHVLWRLDHLALENVSPKLAVVMIGTNNTRDNTPKQIAEGVTKIVEKLRKRLPKTKILLLAVFARGPDKNDPHRRIVEKVNRIISKLGDDKMVIYMDLRKCFVKPDGTPSECLRGDDHVHLTVEGYRAWAEAIEPVVAKVVGKRVAKKK